MADNLEPAGQPPRRRRRVVYGRSAAPQTPLRRSTGRRHNTVRAPRAVLMTAHMDAMEEKWRQLAHNRAIKLLQQRKRQIEVEARLDKKVFKAHKRLTEKIFEMDLEICEREREMQLELHEKELKARAKLNQMDIRMQIRWQNLIIKSIIFIHRHVNK